MVRLGEGGGGEWGSGRGSGEARVLLWQGVYWFAYLQIVIVKCCVHIVLAVVGVQMKQLIV